MRSVQHHLRLQKAREYYTQRLRQRRFDEDIFLPLETAQLWLCVADRSKTCHLSAIPDVSGRVIAAVKDEKARGENSVTWLIYHKDNPTEQIGSIWLFQFSAANAKVGSASLGYSLNEPARGKGYMSEALSGVMQFTFEKLRLEKIEARVRITNERSKGVVRRAGFKYIGNIRKGKWGLGDNTGIEIVEQEVWNLTKEDWEAHLQGSVTTANL